MFRPKNLFSHVLNYRLNSPSSWQSGFSLVELLVVTTLIAVITVMVVLNFRSSATNTSARQQTAAIIVADLRRAQAMAISGSRFQGEIACGYGLHYLSSNRYLIYVRRTEGGVCASTDRNYQPSADSILETKTLTQSSMRMFWAPEEGGRHDDIFFEPPDPQTFINNDSAPGLSVTISIVPVNQSCTGNNCTVITVFTSGRIDMSN